MNNDAGFPKIGFSVERKNGCELGSRKDGVGFLVSGESKMLRVPIIVSGLSVSLSEVAFCFCF